jgi:Putative beta-barrel porin 2
MKIKSERKNPFIHDNGDIRVLSGAVLLALCGLGGGLKAQEVLMSPPTTPEIPTALQPLGTNEMDVFVPAGQIPSQQGAEPFRYQFLTLRPHPYYQALYGDGILVAPGQPVRTVIQQVAPGFLLDIGDHWNLDYTPTWTFYSSDRLKNTLDHAVKLTGGTAYGDWIFRLSQSYTDSTSPQVETATQTSTKTYSTAIDASYTINSKMSLDLDVSQNFISADQFQSYREWSTLDWLNYQFWTRLNVAVGAGLGYDEEDASPDMLFEQYQGRINWRATDKISFQFHGGVEDRQILASGTGDIISPVFGGGIQYQPFENTKLSLNAERAVAQSYFQNEVTESTTVSGGLNQRLLKKLYLDLQGGYQNTKYIDSTSGDSANRTDNYYFLNTRLNCSFLKRGFMAVFFQISDNASSQSGFGFSSHQYGFEIGYRY